MRGEEEEEEEKEKRRGTQKVYAGIRDTKESKRREKEKRENMANEYSTQR
jgi:hypothetical protein